jgi:hypothetical protein
MITLPFTVYCLPHALHSALGALRQRAVQSRACRAVALAKAGPLGPDSLLFFSPDT